MKTNSCYEVVQAREASASGKVLADHVIRLSSLKAKHNPDRSGQRSTDRLAVTGLAVGDDDAFGQHLGEHDVEPDGSFAAPELRPGKDAGAEVYGGIDDFDLWGLLGLLRQFGAEALIGLIVVLFKYGGRAVLIGVGQGGTLYPGKSQVVESADLSVETEHQVPQTFAGAPLAEQHGPEVRPIRESPRFRSMPGMVVHQLIENMSRDEL